MYWIKRLYLTMMCCFLVGQDKDDRDILSLKSYTLSNYGFIAPLRKFTFSKREYMEMLHRNLHKIDTNCVYFIFDSIYFGDSLYIFYSFKRFFGDGVAYDSPGFREEPSVTDYNNLRGYIPEGLGFPAHYGMYCIFGDTLVFEYNLFLSAIVPSWAHSYYLISGGGDSLIGLGSGFGRYKRGRVSLERCERPTCVGVRKQVPLYNWDWRRYTPGRYLRIPWREREARRMAREAKRKGRR